MTKEAEQIIRELWRQDLAAMDRKTYQPPLANWKSTEQWKEAQR